MRLIVGFLVLNCPRVDMMAKICADSAVPESECAEVSVDGFRVLKTKDASTTFHMNWNG